MKLLPSKLLLVVGPLLLAASAASSACTTEAYCFACEQPDGAGGSAATGGTGPTGGTGGTFVQPDGGDADADGADAPTCDDTLSDPFNCGACGNVCSIPGAFPRCENGVCVQDSCAPGFVDLDPDVVGCECEVSGGGQELCDAIDNDCNGTVDDGFDLQNDVNNCGACNNPCPDLPNSTKACSSGLCVYTCDDGFGRPGGNPQQGCPYACPVWPPVAETCNGVDDDCDGAIDNGQPGAGESCTDPCPNGVCVGDCQPGQTACTATGSGIVCVGGIPPAGELCDGRDNDCDGQVDEDFDLQTDALNCGSCGVTCQAGDLCVNGRCQFTCQPGFEDIDRDPANGCEYACPVFPTRAETCDGIDEDCDGIADDGVTLTGSCTTQCPARHPCVATGNCAPFAISPNTGTCYGVCSAGGQNVCLGGVVTCDFPARQLVEACNNVDDNCDGRVDEGFDKQTDPFNCGSCGTVCQRPNTQAMTCAGGVCNAITACVPGFANVNGTVSDGCEYRCPVFPPVGETCNGVDDDCDGVVDNNPGGVGGSCTSGCPAPDPCIAAGNCTSPISQQTNGCYGVCRTDGVTVCTAGAPQCNHPARTTETCNGADDDCDGLIDEGFNTQTDVNHCGACGNRCSLPNTAVHTCVAGSCRVQTCAPGFANLDSGSENGCEYACPRNPPVAETCNGVDDNCDGLIDNNPSGVGASCQGNCPGGVCRGICTPGQTVCVAGALQCIGGTGPQLETCNNVDDDCDGTVDNGFNKQTDPNNCGACGNVCNLPNAIAGCSAGACTIAACRPGFANLNGTVSDGCEHTCEQYPTSAEVCDGRDNDCDGLVDGADTGTGGMIIPPNFCVQTGPCSGSAPVCQGVNGWRCNYQTRDPRIQVQANGSLVVTEMLCDDFDNNCNGQVDETFQLKGTACSVGVGRCAGLSTYVCATNQLGVTCPTSANPLNARDETCNGEDDNCDGQIDERTPTGSLTCYDAGGTNPHPCQGWRDLMANIGGGVFMYAYEASRPAATATDIGTLSSRACSTPGVQAWTSVTFAEATAACAAVRNSNNQPMRLCTEAEWQSACLAGASATPLIWSYPSSPTTYVAGRCNDADASTPAGFWAGGTGANCRVVRNGTNVFDLSGNVAEFTSTTVTLSGVTYARVRGGHTGSLAAATSCTFDFVLQRTNPQPYKNFDTGFRCCSNAAP